MSEVDLKAADIAGLTFDEIEAKYGEEAAINAGIAADPDAFEADAEWFAKARPAFEVHPELVGAMEAQERGEWIPARVFVTVEVDLDIAERLGYDYDDENWQKRVNDALRKAVFGEDGREAAAETVADAESASAAG